MSTYRVTLYTAIKPAHFQHVKQKQHFCAPPLDQRCWVHCVRKVRCPSLPVTDPHLPYKVSFPARAGNKVPRTQGFWSWPCTGDALHTPLMLQGKPLLSDLGRYGKQHAVFLGAIRTMTQSSYEMQ